MLVHSAVLSRLFLAELRPQALRFFVLPGVMLLLGVEPCPGTGQLLTPSTDACPPDAAFMRHPVRLPPLPDSAVTTLRASCMLWKHAEQTT